MTMTTAPTENRTRKKNHVLWIFSSHIWFDLWNIQFYITEYLHWLLFFFMGVRVVWALSLVSGELEDTQTHGIIKRKNRREGSFNLFTVALSLNKYTPPIYLDKICWWPLAHTHTHFFGDDGFFFIFITRGVVYFFAIDTIECLSCMNYYAQLYIIPLWLMAFKHIKNYMYRILCAFFRFIFRNANRMCIL